MCRLLGVVVNKSVDFYFLLSRFKKYAQKNPDGWGVGWYENNEARIFRQGIPATAPESKFPIYSKKVRSRIIIAHVRKGTGAKPAEKNSHPFKHGQWVFVHNGSIDKEFLCKQLREKYRKCIFGETDSEYYFYYILQCIENSTSISEAIRSAVHKIIDKECTYTGLNFLLANGKSLYAFRYSSYRKENYSLYQLTREPSGKVPFKAISAETQQLLESKSLNNEKAILVCSEKLTNENWQMVDFGDLLIIKPDLSVKEIKIV